MTLGTRKQEKYKSAGKFKLKKKKEQLREKNRGAFHFPIKNVVLETDHEELGVVWYIISNIYFQFPNNITRIFIHFFIYTYFYICFQTTKHMFLGACTKCPFNYTSIQPTLVHVLLHVKP